MGAPSSGTSGIVSIVEGRAFDPRTDISADAYHIAGIVAKCSREDAREASRRIVKHLWLIFVLLPVVVYVVYEMATH